jgi:serine/threonine protein kinase, bacterial
MPLQSGETFAGFTIVRLLGSGGMGEVYLAEHPRLPRRDALKVLPTDVSGDQEFQDRFNREADLAASLWHPHIVGIHDRGEFNGRLWISMDYVDGIDAAQLVRDSYPSGMPPDEAIEIIRDIASALDYAHSEGLLHRDVKPANILLATRRSGERRILLADFGIARKIDEVSGITQTNMTVGSVAYSSPEQLRGEHIDGRADQYGLACTAFHLLAGVPPYDGTNPAVVIGQQLGSPPPNLSDKRPELNALDAPLAMAMAKNAVDRYPNCTDFAEDLASRTHSSTISSDATAVARTVAAPITPAAQPEPDTLKDRRGRKRVLSAVAIGLAVGVIVLGVVIFTNRGANKHHSTASTATPANSAPNAPSAPPASNPDLGLSTPISYPACDGEGIVVLGKAMVPGQYVSDVQHLLDVFPGASYLRTDRACPSLLQSTEAGNPIYLVYRDAGRNRAEVCAAVHAAGDGAYGKWLDQTANPRVGIRC